MKQELRCDNYIRTVALGVCHTSTGCIGTCVLRRRVVHAGGNHAATIKIRVHFRNPCKNQPKPRRLSRGPITSLVGRTTSAFLCEYQRNPLQTKGRVATCCNACVCQCAHVHADSYRVSKCECECV